MLFDNDRGLVVRHDRLTREVEFNERLHAFARHWRFRPRACAPYGARTKGKDDRGTRSISGRDFDKMLQPKSRCGDGSKPGISVRKSAVTRSGTAPAAARSRSKPGNNVSSAPCPPPSSA